MKRITLCALLMTLFLLISCNTSGKNLKDDEVAKSDGSVIDLAKITKNIKDSVAFVKSVKEVHTLVKSIDELAKGIKKKITANGLEDDANANAHYTPLLAGAFSVATVIEAKASKLQVTESIDFKDLNDKVGTVVSVAKEFTAKLKSENAVLGLANGAATDENAKKAIDVTNGTKDKGAEELSKLNTAIDTLLTSAEAAVTAAINELTTSTKPSN
ncbi:Vsp/OspC family lipoprotein (plasmid) [Borrelia puertoricensis]|uniref:Vsp/OspC family lipoprotein n=1 Tax=Borrelia puertoricensis TaxID=2756107 RepID=UPI003EBDB68C